MGLRSYRKCGSLFYFIVKDSLISFYKKDVNYIYDAPKKIFIQFKNKIWVSNFYKVSKNK